MTRSELAALTVLATASLFAPATPAQGALMWPDASLPGAYSLIQVRTTPNGTNVYDLCIPRWTMVAGSPVDGDYQAVGVGLSPTVVVDVPGARVVDPESGTQAEPAPLFPFAKDARVASAMRGTALVTGIAHGFLAPVTAAVPDHREVSLCFTITTTATPAAIASGVGLVAAAGATDQGALTGTAQYSVAATGADPTVLYLKFDRGRGGIALNYSGYAPAGSRAAMSPADGSTWTAGPFGGALAAGELRPATIVRSCTTKWHAGLAGPMTIAWYMRRPPATGTPRGDLFGRGAFVCRVAGDGTLRLENWGGPPLATATDVAALATGRSWVHVAIVISPGSGTGGGRATWYVDGDVLDTPTLLAAGVTVALPADPAPFRIGWNGIAAAPSQFDLDELRVVSSAATEATIEGWMAAPDAVAARFSRSCEAGIQHVGEPALGAGYTLQVDGPANAVAILMLGIDVIPPIDLGIVFPHLAGCGVHTTPLDAITAPMGTGGLARFGFAIPNDAGLKGALLFGQALVQESTGRIRATGAHSTSIE